jgi:hypothetical protein
MFQGEEQKPALNSISNHRNSANDHQYPCRPNIGTGEGDQFPIIRNALIAFICGCVGFILSFAGTIRFYYGRRISGWLLMVYSGLIIAFGLVNLMLTGLW